MLKIRLRHGEHEIDIVGTDDFIEKKLGEFYKRIGPVKTYESSTNLQEEISKPSTTQNGKKPTPAEYYTSKNKTDGISQILIFAKYLEEFKNVLEFTRKDINEVAKEVKLRKDIHTQYFTNAVKQGLLRSHGQGKYSLTLSAESVLSKMV